jgi:hypothetical protein
LRLVPSSRYYIYTQGTTGAQGETLEKRRCYT